MESTILKFLWYFMKRLTNVMIRGEKEGFRGREWPSQITNWSVPQKLFNFRRIRI